MVNEMLSPNYFATIASATLRERRSLPVAFSDRSAPALKVMQNLLLGVGIGLVGTLVVLTARYVAAVLAD
jgi:hypothetical protein